MNPPVLARTRRSDSLPEAVETYEEPVDNSFWSNFEFNYDFFANTNFVVENSFQVAPLPEPEIQHASSSEPEVKPKVKDPDFKYFSVSDQILYLDNRNLIVLDYKPSYESNKP